MQMMALIDAPIKTAITPILQALPVDPYAYLRANPDPIVIIEPGTKNISQTMYAHPIANGPPTG